LVKADHLKLVNERSSLGSAAKKKSFFTTLSQDDNSELEKTIEAESSEFSSSIEEFRRKEDLLQDGIEDGEVSTVVGDADAGQDVRAPSDVQPIAEARQLSPGEDEESGGKEQNGKGEGKDTKRILAGKPVSSLFKENSEKRF